MPSESNPKQRKPLLTLEQLLARYGTQTARFGGYSKYNFFYVTVDISIHFGGQAEVVYGLQLNATYSVAELFNHVEVTAVYRDGQLIYDNPPWG